MLTHTIYHIPGLKVGATKDFERRKSEYPHGTEFEVLMDDLDGLSPKEVGNWEWWWADYLGYPRGRHYASSVQTPERRVKLSMTMKISPKAIAQRTEKAKAQIGIPKTEETKAKISAANLGVPKPPRTPEHSAANAEARRGAKRTEEARAKMSASKIGKPQTEAHKAAVKKACVGCQLGIPKGPMSEEQKAAISLAKTGKKQTKVTCPHCGKVGGYATMPRWHFNNCKMRGT